MAWVSTRNRRGVSPPLVTTHLQALHERQRRRRAGEGVIARPRQMCLSLAYIGWLARTRNFLPASNCLADLAAAAHLSAIDIWRRHGSRTSGKRGREVKSRRRRPL